MNAHFFLSLVAMFATRYSYTLCILLISCFLHAQRIQVLLPFPAKVAINNHVFKGEKNVWTIQVDADINYRVQIIQNDSVIVEKQISVALFEDRVYHVEEIEPNTYGMFYRSTPFSASPTIEELTSVNTMEEVDSIEATPAALEDNTSQPSMPIAEALETGEVSGESHEQALDRIRSIQYEFEKTREIISWCENYSPTTNQIGEFVELLSYDPSKFMLVQRLYPLCSDKSNYQQLESSFQYDNFKMQFQEWLADQN